MPCVELAERLEVLLLIEPEPGLLIERFEQYLELAGRVDSPWLGLNFDIGHAYCVGEEPQDVDRADGPPHEALSPRGHRRRRGSTSTWFPAGGRLTFAAVLREIARSGYQGWITVELYPYIDDPDRPAARPKDIWRPLTGLSGERACAKAQKR